MHQATIALLLTAVSTFASTSRAGSPAAAADAPEPGETPPPGQSAPPMRFGTSGSRAIGFDSSLGAANSGLATHPLSFGSRLTFDTFVLEGLSIGGSLGFEYSHAGGADFYNVGGGPRVGYALRLGDHLALWPKVFLDYAAGVVPTTSLGAPGAPLQFTGNVASLEDLRVGVHVPLVFVLGGHVALEFGPVASTDLWRRVAGQPTGRMELLGMQSGIIGWF